MTVGFRPTRRCWGGHRGMCVSYASQRHGRFCRLRWVPFYRGGLILTSRKPSHAVGTWRESSAVNTSRSALESLASISYRSWKMKE